MKKIALFFAVFSIVIGVHGITIILFKLIFPEQAFEALETWMPSMFIASIFLSIAIVVLIEMKRG